jgi:hypothetical protein
MVGADFTGKSDAWHWAAAGFKPISTISADTAIRMGAISMNNVNQVFAVASARSGELQEYVIGELRAFAPETPSLYQGLIDAVAEMRVWFAERSYSPALKAARGGVEAVVPFLLKGGRFDSARDNDGLDAGYWMVRQCLPYDFVALGVVAQAGPIQQVQPVRYYNQHVDGRAAFMAALEAGLSFSQCRDEEGHDAGFFVARCGDDEVIARFEQAGGQFRQRELEWLGRVSSRKVA